MNTRRCTRSLLKVDATACHIAAVEGVWATRDLLRNLHHQLDAAARALDANGDARVAQLNARRCDALDRAFEAADRATTEIDDAAVAVSSCKRQRRVRCPTQLTVSVPTIRAKLHAASGTRHWKRVVLDPRAQQGAEFVLPERQWAEVESVCVAYLRTAQASALLHHLDPALSLRTLRVRCTRLSDGDMRDLARVVVTAPHLEELSMEFVEWSDQGIAELLRAPNGPPRLRELRVAQVAHTVDAWHNLSVFIDRCPALAALYLPSNSALRTTSAVRLLHVAARRAELHTLHLGNFELNDAVFAALAAVLSSCPVHTLALRWWTPRAPSGLTVRLLDTLAAAPPSVSFKSLDLFDWTHCGAGRDRGVVDALVRTVGRHASTLQHLTLEHVAFFVGHDLDTHSKLVDALATCPQFHSFGVRDAHGTFDMHLLRDVLTRVPTCDALHVSISALENWYSKDYTEYQRAVELVADAVPRLRRLEVYLPNYLPTFPYPGSADAELHLLTALMRDGANLTHLELNMLGFRWWEHRPAPLRLPPIRTVNLQTGSIDVSTRESPWTRWFQAWRDAQQAVGSEVTWFD